MRIRLVLLATTVALTACGSSAHKGQPSGPVKAPPGAVAQVGSRTITAARLASVLASERATYRRQHKPFPAAKARREAIDYLLQSAVLQQAAANMGLTVTERQVENQIEELKAQDYQGDSSQMLRSMKRQGLTLHELRAQEREQLTEQAIRGRMAQTTHVPEAVARAYYAKHKAAYAIPASRLVRHILVKKKSLADQIYAELKAGASFDALAKRYSIDTSTRQDGGRLTDTRGSFVAPFEQVAFSLKTHEIAPPVHTVYGWHVIQALADVQPAVPQPYSKVETAIKSLLLPDQQDKALAAFTKRTDRAWCKGKIAFGRGYATDFCSRTRLRSR